MRVMEKMKFESKILVPRIAQVGSLPGLSSNVALILRNLRTRLECSRSLHD